VRPAPSSPDRVRGRIEGPFDARARAACRASAADGKRARWRQYRAVWAFVEGSACRRRTILRHFGDKRTPVPQPGVPCCDVCDASWVPAPPATRRSRAQPRPGDDRDLDGAVVRVVESATPPVGRTRAVEILRGGRAKALVAHGYDGLPEYGTFDHLSAGDVLTRIDELIEAGRLRSTGGAFPKLELADDAPAAPAAAAGAAGSGVELAPDAFVAPAAVVGAAGSGVELAPDAFVAPEAPAGAAGSGVELAPDAFVAPGAPAGAARSACASASAGSAAGDRAAA
jgi:ATP-dependent DNA helicase RecQ